MKQNRPWLRELAAHILGRGAGRYRCELLEIREKDGSMLGLALTEYLGELRHHAQLR